MKCRVILLAGLLMILARTSEAFVHGIPTRLFGKHRQVRCPNEARRFTTVANMAKSPTTHNKNDNDKILIVGATGTTGARAIQGFLDVGIPPSQLKVITRKTSSSSSSLSHFESLGGIHICHGIDLDDPQTLVDIGHDCSFVYVHSTVGDTKQLETLEVSRAQALVDALLLPPPSESSRPIQCIVYNSVAAELEKSQKVPRIGQKWMVEEVLSKNFRTVSLRANLFMEEVWKSYTRPNILKGTFAFSVPSDRKIYLSSVRDMGRLAGRIILKQQQHQQQSKDSEIDPSLRVINVASDHLTPAQMALNFGECQTTSTCVHKQSILLRFLSFLFFRDLYKMIQFYRTTMEITDIAALVQDFPGFAPTRFKQFLKETHWDREDGTYEDCIAKWPWET